MMLASRFAPRVTQRVKIQPSLFAQNHTKKSVQFTNNTRLQLPHLRKYHPPEFQFRYLQDYSKSRALWQTNKSTTVTREGQKRWQHYYRKSDPYTRFTQGQHVFEIWRRRPTFWYEVAGIGVLAVAFYEWNMETVPVSGRRRFNIISPDAERSFAQQQYRQIIQEYRGRILPNGNPTVRTVQHVLERLLPTVGMDDLKWEVYVIDSEEKNAFVIPGGKVFVFSGILSVANNQSRLATVLAHEIAHTLAHHSAERLSSSLAVYMPLIWICQFVGIPDIVSQLSVDLVLSKPGSRTQEAEADYIGMMLMAQACFEPEAAVGLWEAMEREEKKRGGVPPQFLSTHPSSHSRIQQIKEWMVEARQKQTESDCSRTLEYAQEFRKALGGPRPW
ncbi:hypothetical protein EV356DRAFT_499505 [Viridothelium virens]|uniref:Peptidase M48 domain-containing protein n=1 Tax=Viridothelium virens TaxID=1048519 RepID=A0A6A6HDC5_VIRVR|nr:hypothetical protein EV356DRAFT_499505 [Viridothelium virens]